MIKVFGLVLLSLIGFSGFGEAAGAEELVMPTQDKTEVVAQKPVPQEKLQKSPLFVAFNLLAQDQADKALGALKEYLALPVGEANRSHKFSQALEYLNKAVEMDKNNPDYKFLGAKIYRVKSGSSYAKKYFRQGCFIMEQRLESNSAATNNYLEYAIALVTGDTRFWPDYAEYEKRGLELAKKGLGMLPTDTGSPELLYQRALFKVLLEDYEGAERDFKMLGDIQPPEWYLTYRDEFDKAKVEILKQLEGMREGDAIKCRRDGFRKFLEGYVYDTSRHISIDYSK